MEKRSRRDAGYLTVIGDRWAAARERRRCFPDKPFVGIRFDQDEGWVVFECFTAAGPVNSATLAEIERLFESVDADAWCDELVFLCHVRSIAHGRRVVRRVISILEQAAG